MKVLIASPEVVPFAKTGGLADVAGALPKALKNLGHDVRVILPRYRMVDEKNFGLRKVAEDIHVKVGERDEIAEIFETFIPGTDVITYFVANDKYFDRDDLYQSNGKDFDDNLERFTFFSQAALRFIKLKRWEPHVLHANDWQTALMIAYLKDWEDSFFNNIASVYSVHNMGYHGIFPRERVPVTGLGWDKFTPEGLEFYGNLALSKAGFVYADVINTVSEQYALEIQTPEYGHGMEGLLKARSRDVYGILNGIDYDLWNPETDPAIPYQYSLKALANKKKNKTTLQKANLLPPKKDIPLIGIISRLADQKGFDLVAEIMEEMMHLDLQLVVLGVGDLKYHELLLKEKKNYPEHIGVNLGFDAALAQLIYAGADMFLMPSRYEPCGLGQLISFKYGTIPVVRHTGGLADTVHNVNPETKEGDGFVFYDYRSDELLDAVERAVEVYHDRKTWDLLVRRVMKYDFSWDASARKYVSLYKKAMEKVGLTANLTTS